MVRPKATSKKECLLASNTSEAPSTRRGPFPSIVAMNALLSSSRNGHVLLVSDMPGFAELGGHIALIQDRNKFRFQINLRAVQQTGLTLSSRLLQLAEIVAKQAEALSPAQLDAVAGAQPPAARLPLLVALLLNLSDDAGDLLLRAVGVHDGHAAMATPRAAAPPVERAPPVELAAPAFSMAARVGGGGGGAPT